MIKGNKWSKNGCRVKGHFGDSERATTRYQKKQNKPQHINTIVNILPQLKISSLKLKIILRRGNLEKNLLNKQ